VGGHRARGQKDKSFLVLFFKKEQKKTSFLKKRSKKLLIVGLGAGGGGGAHYRGLDKPCVTAKLYRAGGEYHVRAAR
jgi:hypothetical protein